MPLLALKIVLKTASGELISTRQYTDSAGYEFSVTAGKSFFDNEDNLLKCLKVFLELGFIAWDINLREQNDAYKVSTGVTAKFKKVRLDFGTFYYKGWQDSTVDEVFSLNVRGTHQLAKNAESSIEFRKGLSNAALKNYIGLGVRLYFRKNH